MALPIKDGNAALTSLKTTLTGSDHMPHHIVQAVSGTVTVTSSVSSPVYISGTTAVTASSTNPVYVTGAVSISQPVSVDVVVGDNIFVTSSLSAPLYVSSSNNSPILVTGTVGLQSNTVTASISSSTINPVYVQLNNITTTGITSGSGTALVVSLSGGIGNENKVQLYDSYVTIANTGINQLIGYLTAATDLGNSDYRLKVITTGSSAVTINNNAADAAFNALSYSFADNSLKVKLTGSNTIQEGGKDILLVRGTGSQTEITNTGFGQLVNNLTAAIDTGDNTYKLLVKTTGSSNVTINNTTGSPANVRLSDINTYSFSGGTALVVKVTASTTDPYTVNLDGVSKYSYTGGAGLVTKITGTSNADPIWVTGTVTTNASVTVNDGLKVELSGTNVKQISGSSTNTYLQTSIAAVATGSSLKVFAPPNWGGPVPSGDQNVIIIDWSTSESGTFCAASASVSRKSLTIFNNSPHNFYMLIGNPWGGLEATNGFSLYQTSSIPNMSSFILYPSGAYSADPHNVGIRHNMFLTSGTIDGETRILVTETY
jgi:hypothetical protein